ncbi:MAG: hypothetical protein KDI71_04940 [Xanthomonadales bacterium]|nr:hypothetical protein [Xanthomonadales bacterium]
MNKPVRYLPILGAWLAAMGANACASTVTVSAVNPLAGSFSALVEAADGGPAYLRLDQPPFSAFSIRFKADFSDIAGQFDGSVPALALLDTEVEQRIRFRLMFLPDGILFTDGVETAFATVNPEQIGPGMHGYELNIDVAGQTVSLLIDGVPRASFNNDFAPSTSFNQLRFGLTAGVAGAGSMKLDDFSLQLSGQPVPAFFDDFESGNTSLWTATIP